MSSYLNGARLFQLMAGMGRKQTPAALGTQSLVVVDHGHLAVAVKMEGERQRDRYLCRANTYAAALRNGDTVAVQAANAGRVACEDVKRVGSAHHSRDLAPVRSRPA